MDRTHHYKWSWLRKFCALGLDLAPNIVALFDLDFMRYRVQIYLQEEDTFFEIDKRVDCHNCGFPYNLGDKDMANCDCDMKHPVCQKHCHFCGWSTKNLLPFHMKSLFGVKFKGKLTFEEIDQEEEPPPTGPAWTTLECEDCREARKIPGLPPKEFFDLLN